ncbi:hypothetical protein ACFLZW_02435 [Chloroflexota bacterium]
MQKSTERTFLITGDAGSGKSTVMAWLYGDGSAPSDLEERKQLVQIRARAKAIHYCAANDVSTISPRSFAESIANQLTRTVKGFGEALKAALEDQRQITGVAHAGTAARGASLTGVHIEQINLGGLGDMNSFDRAFVAPLQNLYENGYNQPLLILVDALDEAETYDGTRLHLLLSNLNPDKLPPQVRILASTRSDRRVLKYYDEAPHFDLVNDAPHNQDEPGSVMDIQNHIRAQLARDAPELGEKDRNQLARHISAAAEGIFLYAVMLLPDLLPRLHEIEDLGEFPLPKGLSGLYADFFDRELGEDSERWYERFKPLLGLIAVAQGAGLTKDQIELITKKDPEHALLICIQYLKGKFPDGPFQVFHRSLTEFLLENPENENYKINAAKMHKRIADFYWKTHRTNWQGCDPYGLSHLPVHLSGAGETERLRALLLDFDWLQAKISAFGHTIEYVNDLDLAISEFNDPVEITNFGNLIKLFMARSVAIHYSRTYQNDDLKALVWLGRTRQAISHARQRSKIYGIDEMGKFNGLLSILTALQKKQQADPSFEDDALIDDLIVELRDMIDDIFNSGRKKFAITELLTELCQFDKLGEAKEISLDHKENLEVAFENDAMFAVMARVFAENGDYENAKEIIRATGNKVDRITALGVLAVCYTQSGKHSEAEDAFAHAKTEIDTAFIYDDGTQEIKAQANLAEALFKADRLLEAKQGFCKAEKAGKKINHSFNQPVALGELALKKELLGLTIEASELFELALNSADSEKYRAYEEFTTEAKILLSGILAQANRIEMADEIFVEVYQERLNNKKVTKALSVYGIKALQQVVIQLVKTNQTDSANRIVDSIVDEYAKMLASSALASALAEMGKRENAEEMLNYSRQISLQEHDYRSHEHALMGLAIALAKDGKFNQAKTIAMKIEYDDKRDETLINILGEMVNNSKNRNATQLIENIGRIWRKIEAKVTFALQYAENDKEDKVEELLLEVKKEGRLLFPDRAWHEKDAFYRTVTTLAKLGDIGEGVLDEYFGVLEECIHWSDRKSRKRSAILLVTALAKSGRTQSVREQTNKLATLLDKSIDVTQPYVVLTETLANNGEFKNAHEIVEQIPKNTYDWYHAQKELAIALAKNKRFDEARLIADRLRPSQKRDAILSHYPILIELAIEQAKISSGSGKQHMFNKVREQFLWPDYSYNRELILKELAVAYGRAGYFREALQVSKSLSPDALVEIISSWHPGCKLEEQSEFISNSVLVSILERAIAILGWVRSDWKQIYTLITAPVSKK